MLEGSHYLTLAEVKANPFMAIAYCDNHRNIWFVAAPSRERAVGRLHEIKEQRGKPDYIVVVHFDAPKMELFYAAPANARAA